MKKLAIALLVINLAVFSWLIVGASMELPPWQQAFDDAKTAINELGNNDHIRKAENGILLVRLERAEEWSRITIEEYQRSDGPLVTLTVLNIIGLSIIVLWNRKGTKPGVISGSDKPKI